MPLVTKAIAAWLCVRAQPACKCLAFARFVSFNIWANIDNNRRACVRACGFGDDAMCLCACLNAQFGQTIQEKPALVLSYRDWFSTARGWSSLLPATATASGWEVVQLYQRYTSTHRYPCSTLMHKHDPVVLNRSWQRTRNIAQIVQPRQLRAFVRVVCFSEAESGGICVLSLHSGSIDSPSGR